MLLKDRPSFQEAAHVMLPASAELQLMTTGDGRRFVRLKDQTWELTDEGVLLPSTVLDCDDCEMDICSEFINLRNELWLAVPGPRAFILCIGCIEKRLGRRLVRDDFKKEPQFREGYCSFGLWSIRLSSRLNR